MRKISLLLCALFMSIMSFSQSTYIVSTVGTNYSLESLRTAIESADFCGYHYKNSERILIFDDGSKVELKSASTLQQEGISLDSNCFIDDQPANDLVVWSVSESGVILRKMSIANKKKQSTK